ncbi:MAG: hypothetical protein KAT29_03520, partial [Anaerolineales bacterium]|nr:hypothetical protein [Anaerolineales bacterium]
TFLLCIDSEISGNAQQGLIKIQVQCTFLELILLTWKGAYIRMFDKPVKCVAPGRRRYNSMAYGNEVPGRWEAEK